MQSALTLPKNSGTTKKRTAKPTRKNGSDAAKPPNRIKKQNKKKTAVFHVAFRKASRKHSLCLSAPLPFFRRDNCFCPFLRRTETFLFAVFAGGRDKKCFFAYLTHPSRRRLNQTNICKFRTAPLRQAAVYSPLSFSFFATLFRYCFGARPIWRLKTFIKWLGDEKPMSIAMSVMLLLVVSRSL